MRGGSAQKGYLFQPVQVYESVGTLLVEVYKRVGNLSSGSVKGLKRANKCIVSLVGIDFVTVLEAILTSRPSTA